MTTYNPSDVILVKIAFSGAVGYKRRPAVIISEDVFNQAGTKLIVVALTSNISPPLRPGDTLLSDWKSASLLKPSATRGVLATVDKADIYRKLGTLSTTDFNKVQEGIASILGFSVSSSTP
jgi:mRNA interferase MazF